MDTLFDSGDAALDEVITAGHCTDPCDGRTQGATGMFDSLAYRNDAASVLPNGPVNHSTLRVYLAGDQIRIIIDRHRLEGSVDLVGDVQRLFSPEEAEKVLRERTPLPELSEDPALPPETRHWAALQRVSGGPWAGSILDVDRIVEKLG